MSVEDHSSECTCGKGSAPIKDHADECTYVKRWDPDRFDGVTLDHNRALCAVHGEVFLDEWPRGYPIFMVKAFQIVAGYPSVIADARRVAGLAADADVTPRQLGAAFDVKPMCCRLPPLQLASLIEDARHGARKHCSNCGEKRAGEAIQTSNMGRIPHLCYRCLAFASSTPQHVH